MNDRIDFPPSHRAPRPDGEISAERTARDALARFTETRCAEDFEMLFCQAAGRMLNAAQRITRDPNLAEDAVQASFVDVLAAPQRFDPSRPVLPWLCAISANKARMILRSARRRTPTTELAPGTAPAVDQSLLRSEELALIRHALNRLPTRYRETVSMHLLDEDTAATIAQRLNQPLGTIKSKIRRGLERLRIDVRRALNAALAAIWWPGMRPPARLACMPSSSSFAVVGRGTRSTWITPTLVTLLVVPLWLWLQPPANAHARTEVADAGSSQFAPGQVPRVPRSDAPPSARQAFSHSPTPREGQLEVHVRWSDRTNADGVWLRARPKFGPNPPLHEQRARTAQGGRARFPRLAPGKWTILSDRAGTRDLTIEASREPQHLTFDLPRGVTLVGQVTDHDGQPASHAPVWLSLATPLDDGHEAGRTDHRGRFELRDVQPQRTLTSYSPAAIARLYPIEGEPGSVVKFEMRLEATLRSIRGVVFDAENQPVSCAQVIVGRMLPRIEELGGLDPSLAMRVLRNRTAYLPSRTDTDPSGAFSARYVDAGSRVSAWVRRRGRAPYHTFFDPSRQGSVQLRLPVGTTVRGRVVDSHGQPVPDVAIRARNHALQDGQLRMSSPAWSDSTGFSDADGRFALAGVPLGPTRILAKSREQVVIHDIDLTVESTKAPVALTMSRPNSIQGRVFGPSGAPLERWLVSLMRPPRLSTPRVATTDANGWFSFDRCAAAPHMLSVSHRRLDPRMASVTRTDVRPGPAVQIAVPWNCFPSARRTLELADSLGHRLPNLQVETWSDGIDSDGDWCGPTRWRSNARGRVRIGPLPPGRHRFRIRNGSEPVCITQPILFGTSRKQPAVRILIPTLGRLVCAPSTRPLSVEISCADSGIVVARARLDRPVALPPGGYRVRELVTAPNVGTEWTVHIESGSDTQLELPAENTR